MTETGAAALRALEALARATADPPPANAEPDQVLALGEKVLSARERPLAELAAILEKDPHALRGLPGVDDLRARIEERAAVWQAAVARARHMVGERVQAVSRLRRLSRP